MNNLEAVTWLSDRWQGWSPEIGVVLGSGIELSDEAFQEEDRIAVCEIPGLPQPSVAGHGGEWIRYSYHGQKILVMGGRIHLYEGYGVEEVTRGVKVLAALGASSLILTNAAGGIRDGFAPGTVVAITDHIQLQGLVSQVPRKISHQHSDRQSTYDQVWLEHVEDLLAEEFEQPIPRGTYAALIGPVYETPAEVQMLKKLGADMVGMSTVLEAQAAVSSGVRVLAFSLVTNLAAGISTEKLDHQEVLETGKRSQSKMVKIIRAAIEASN